MESVNTKKKYVKEKPVHVLKIFISYIYTRTIIIKVNKFRVNREIIKKKNA